ncbi:hypothetical protein DFJ77DRAFT_437147 [Powellomyces hirtus]|nr:hypothetical protein DFJ77DRAFT_437147 [Powellomyces hirtus]
MAHRHHHIGGPAPPPPLPQHQHPQFAHQHNQTDTLALPLILPGNGNNSSTRLSFALVSKEVLLKTAIEAQKNGPLPELDPMLLASLVNALATGTATANGVGLSDSPFGDLSSVTSLTDYPAQTSISSSSSFQSSAHRINRPMNPTFMRQLNRAFTDAADMPSAGVMAPTGTHDFPIPATVTTVDSAYYDDTASGQAEPQYSPLPWDATPTASRNERANHTSPVEEPSAKKQKLPSAENAPPGSPTTTTTTTTFTALRLHLHRPGHRNTSTLAHPSRGENAIRTLSRKETATRTNAGTGCHHDDYQSRRSLGKYESHDPRNLVPARLGCRPRRETDAGGSLYPQPCSMAAAYVTRCT